MDYSRRRVLAFGAIGISGIAGCLGDDTETDESNSGSSSADGSTPAITDADSDGVSDEDDDYPRDQDLSQKETKSETRKIEEDEWLSYEFDFNSTSFLEFDFIVRDGPEIDVIFLEESEFTYFENAGRYEYKTNLSVLDSGGATVSGKVSEGTYRLILDNSEKGEATPPTNFSNDVATVDFDLEIGR